MAYTLYHNPRCSKSRQTLEILQQHNVDVTVVEYLKQPPSVAQLSDISNRLGLPPREFMRRGEAEYKQLNLDTEELSESELLQTMHDHPKLIERPILVSDKGAVIGRPPEAVLSLLTP